MASFVSEIHKIEKRKVFLKIKNIQMAMFPLKLLCATIWLKLKVYQFFMT